MIKWGICCLQNPKWFPKHCATWWKEKSDTVTILYLGRNISHVTKYCVHTCSVMSNSLLLCLWDFPCKNTGVGCYFLLQNIFLMQRLNPGLLCLLNCRWILYHWATGKPTSSLGWQKKKKKRNKDGDSLTLSMFISTVHSKTNSMILTTSGRRTKMRELMKKRGFPGGSAVNAMPETQVRKIPWRRKWQPTPVFLPENIPWTEESGRL